MLDAPTRRKGGFAGQQDVACSQARESDHTNDGAGQKPRNTRTMWFKGREARQAAAISNQQTLEWVATALVRTAGAAGWIAMRIRWRGGERRRLAVVRVVLPG